MCKCCKSMKSLVVTGQEELSTMATVLEEVGPSVNEQSHKRNIMTSQVQSKSVTYSGNALNSNYSASGQQRHECERFHTGDGVPYGHKCNIPGVSHPRVYLYLRTTPLSMCTSCCVRQKSEYRTPLYKMCEDVFHIGVFKPRYINKTLLPIEFYVLLFL